VLGQCAAGILHHCVIFSQLTVPVLCVICSEFQIHIYIILHVESHMRVQLHLHLAYIACRFSPPMIILCI